MKTQFITVSGGLQVSIGNYVQAIKKAKANPKMTFNRGLTQWWPCTGEEIMLQFMEGVHDRINIKSVTRPINIARMKSAIKHETGTK